MMEWPNVRVGDVCDVIIGATPARNQPEYWGGGNVWVTVAELKDNVITASREHITDAGVAHSASKLIPAGNLLFSFKLSIGKMAFAGVDLYTNEAIAALPIRHRNLADPRYLFYALRSIGFISGANVAAKGRILNKSAVEALPVPLPPLSEQRRIVEILDQADHLCRLRAEVDAKADRILPALLAKALGPVSAWDSDPRSRPLGELVDFVSGGTPSKKNERLWNGEIPWVSPKDMKEDFIQDTQDHISRDALDEAGLQTVQAENVLLVVRGMILARTVPVALNLRSVTINQDMKALVPKGRNVTGRYLWAALYLARTRLITLVRTAGHGTRKLDTPDLLGFSIVVPSASQLRVVDDAVRARQTDLENRSHARIQVTRLFSNLLSQAFSGELTASWREAHMKDLLQEMEHQAKALAAPARPE